MLNARTPVLNGALSENGLQVQFMVINMLAKRFIVSRCTLASC